LITYLADKIGRKRSIQATAVLCIIAGALQAGSVHIAMFLVARFMMGVGVGMVNVITPLYQSEVSPAKSRGRLVGSHGFILCVGYVCEDSKKVSGVRANTAIGARRLDRVRMLFFEESGCTMASMSSTPDCASSLSLDRLTLAS
jgi:nitrate/nitrite transporter NarK